MEGNMATDMHYYSASAGYVRMPGTIYAVYETVLPNPCRKYHISSDLQSAERVAAIVLPFLAQRKVYHKVVQSTSLLDKQMGGMQAGKFITAYLPSHLEQKN